MEPLTVHLLSGPRNISTALMYAFAQRSDCRVVDEPLYGYYLHETGAPQPHIRELLEVLPTDGPAILRDTVLRPPPDCSVYFVKNMAHHLLDLNPEFLQRVRNVFLIRDPRQMLPSLINQIEHPTPRDAAYEDQARWHRELVKDGAAPLVIDSRDLLLDPPGMLSRLCSELGIAYDAAMLSWEPGPRPEDGPWAPYWYHNLHLSRGFQPYREKTEPFPERLLPLLDRCLPPFHYLSRHTLKVEDSTTD